MNIAGAIRTHSKTLPLEPARQEVVEAFAELDRFKGFWEANFEKLRVVYPDEFVAIQDGRIVAHASDLDELDAQLDTILKTREGLQIRFVRFKTPSLVL